MTYKTYKQYDSRWGNKNYNGSSTMAAAGCGPTACATVISNHNPKINPIKTMKYMQEHGYAIRNNGTAWNGIPSCMKWGGLKEVGEMSTMSELWAYMKKHKHACGVLLFRAGTKGGVTWTTAGHFVAFTAYKVVDGKHYLWTRDPGGRNHDGWFCYETKMQGLIVKVWAGISNPQKSKQEIKLDKIKHMAVKCSWPKGTGRSKKGYPEGHPKKAYKKALNAAYPNRSGWRDQTHKGASCDVFVGTVIRASGVDKKFPRGCDDVPGYMKTDNARKIWKEVKSHKMKDIPDGAFIFQIYESGAKHITIKVNGKFVANAHYCSRTYPVIESYKHIVRSDSACRVFKVYVPRG